MSIQYTDIVPWGRNLDEYIHMFDLSNADLEKSVLGCGDGPASFNIECNQRGGNVISIDPIYHFSHQEIEKRIAETYDYVMHKTRANQDKFIWDAIQSPDELGRIRMETMQKFLTSYDEGISQGKYIPGELPELPFEDQAFDVALSSHFLFLYSDNLTFEFHVAAIREMLRVACEVRIFPLVDLNAQESRYLAEILNVFQEYSPEIREVNYEFQRGGNKMLSLRNR